MTAHAIQRPVDRVVEPVDRAEVMGRLDRVGVDEALVERTAVRAGVGLHPVDARGSSTTVADVAARNPSRSAGLPPNDGHCRSPQAPEPE